jgi:hypothetical protein
MEFDDLFVLIQTPIRTRDGGGRLHSGFGYATKAPGMQGNPIYG